MRLSVRQHQLRRRAVEQMKNAGAVAVDERSGHADDLFRRAEQLCHRVALAAVVVVLVQLIHDKPVEPAAVPLLDVRAERIPPARAACREIPVRILVKRQQSIQRSGVLCLLHGMGCQLPMHPTVFRDLDPRCGHAWIHRCPQQFAAIHALMIAPVFHAERLRFRGHPVVCIVAAWQFYDGTTAGAAERAFSRVKQNRRAAHIAVSGFFLTDDGVDAFVALPVLCVQTVQLYNAADKDARSLWQRFGNFTHPLLRDVRRAKNDVERLFPFLCLIRRQRCCADLRFSRPTFRYDKCGFALRELAPDRFRNRKLRRAKAVARVCADIVVDAQNLRGKLLRGGVKERLELLSDTLRDDHTERRQIAGDRMHAAKAIGVLNRTENMNGTGFQAILQHLDDIGVILFAQKQPRLQPFPNGDDAQRLEKSAPLQFVQNIVLKLRDKRHSRFPVQLFKQRLPVSGRAKKDALSRRQLYIRLPAHFFLVG